MKLVLIIYYCSDAPIRTTIEEHLYCFSRYSNHRTVYLNLAVRDFTKSILAAQHFDAIIFHTTFLSVRAWSPNVFRLLLKKIDILRQYDAIKLGLPQDEFLNTELLCEFFNSFGIQHIYSVMPEDTWCDVYGPLNKRVSTLHRILTGYLDERALRRIDRFNAQTDCRPIDVGYRAWRAEPWLGKHGMLKTKIATVVSEAAARAGLRTDISTRAEDTILGEDWYRFLSRCRFTIGVEGGASILDKDGTIKAKTEAYLRNNKMATFEDVQANCFAGLDGRIKLVAISPRHLECCATRTGQILIEGSYNHILVPGRHYIELKQDFSNIDEVIELSRSESFRTEMIGRAYDDIVRSEKYSYRAFVNFLFQTAGIGNEKTGSIPKSDMIYLIEDNASWAYLRLRKKAVAAVGIIPKPFKNAIKRLIRR